MQTQTNHTNTCTRNTTKTCHQHIAKRTYAPRPQKRHQRFHFMQHGEPGRCAAAWPHHQLVQQLLHSSPCRCKRVRRRQHRVFRRFCFHPSLRSVACVWCMIGNCSCVDCHSHAFSHLCLSFIHDSFYVAGFPFNVILWKTAQHAMHYNHNPTTHLNPCRRRSRTPRLAVPYSPPQPTPQPIPPLQPPPLLGQTPCSSASKPGHRQCARLPHRVLCVRRHEGQGRQHIL